MNPLTIFTDIKFDAPTHTYTVDGIPLRSVSSVYSAYVPPFDAPRIAAKVAAKRGTTPETLIAEWEAKRDRAAAKGTKVHDYIQSVLRPAPVDPNAETDAFLALNAAPVKLPEMEAFDKFMLHAADLKLQIMEVEWVVGDKELRIAGTVDAVAFSEVTGKWHILDWKTNENYNTENRWENLLPPFSSLPNCEHAKYSLQISLYRLLIERNFPKEWGDPLNIMGSPYIVHLDQYGDFTVHRPHDCRPVFQRILTIPEEPA
jgi:ATP-dependent exoDNAse (exonuclease V) beta subunit